MNPLRPLSLAFFATSLLAQGGDPAITDHIASAAQDRTGWPFDRVLYDTGIDGRLWAVGAEWKASFGADGFTFVPRFGMQAPSSPMRLQLTAVRVGGRSLPLATDVAPTRRGDVVTFARGAASESYHLALGQVEQTFTVEAGPGDVEVELTLATGLAERAELPGLQFANAHGEVGYSDAFLVRGNTKTPIATSWDGQRITLRVAAEQRGDGPVVIDPVLTVRTGSTTSAVITADVGYDAALQRYLLVWEVGNSSTDHDVFTEQFDAAGNLIAATALPIEISGLFAEHPRTAYLTAAGSFLVAFALYDPNVANRRMVYSRTFHPPTAAVGPYERLSNPFLPGENIDPEVGGDPGTDPASPHDWLVVWSHVESATDSNVHGRAVLANGTPKHSWVLVIEDGVNTLNEHPQVSRSNGNGQVPHPLWLVVYERGPIGFHRPFGRTLALGFVAGAEVPFGGSFPLERNPQVSAPMAFGATSAFLVTWETPLQSASTAFAAFATFQPSFSGGTTTDLSAAFGLAGIGLRCESDGVRFAVSSRGATANERVVSTLAMGGSGLVLHDGPTVLNVTSPFPELVACRNSGGGPIGEYGIVTFGPSTASTPVLTRYGGHQGGTTVSVLGTACQGLGIQHSGSPILGDAMQFALSNATGDIPGFAFGFPATSPIPICATCSLGLRLDLPIVVDFGSTTFTVPIPPIAGLVGSTFGVQGLGLGPWLCFNLRFSDTVQFTIR